MKIELATDADYQYIVDRDKHISTNLILPKVNAKEIYIVRNHEGDNIGWFRYGYFWDNTPFMNMLWIDNEYRNNGIGKQAVLYWEQVMREQGYKLVMTSTLANEEAQHFYRKMCYRDAGCLLLDNDPLEIILIKHI